MADKLIQLSAGDYTVRDVVADTTATVTVPALTAGSIVQATPSVGDTLTVTGSNATAKATFQWQDSTDGSTGWADITGATAATLDTTGLPAKFYRRGVTGLTQGPVYTAAVEVTAAAPDLFTFLGAAAYGSSTTVPDLPIGTAAADRVVILAVSMAFDTTILEADLSFTIGGVAATKAAVARAYNKAVSAIVFATVPTGTTADLVISKGGSSANFERCNVGRYVGNNIVLHNSAVNQSTGSSVAASVDVTAGGSVLAMGSGRNGSETNIFSITPGTMTKDYEVLPTAFEPIGAGFSEHGLSVETGRTITLTEAVDISQTSLAVASFKNA